MIQPHLDFEKEIWSQNLLCCGVDEVGRGCIAGPVVAAAVVIDVNHKIHPKVRDSKTLTPKMRQEVFDYILENNVDFGVGLVPATEIDKIGITDATHLAMSLATEMLNTKVAVALIDGKEINNLDIKQKAIIKGDAHVYSISAASVIAKVYRDAIVSGLDNQFEGYDFKSHKGYGTKKHYEAIAKIGLTVEHRKTFIH